MKVQFKLVSLVEKHNDRLLNLDLELENDLEQIFESEAIDIRLLKIILTHLCLKQLKEWIQTNKTRALVRKVWFIYEYFVHKIDEIDSIQQDLDYVSILNSNIQITLNSDEISERHKVKNNMISFRDFFICIQRSQLNNQLKQLDNCDSFQSERINSYIFDKETKFSHLIEGEKAKNKFRLNFDRVKTFTLQKEELVKLQNELVDEQFKTSDWRKIQNYVGRTVQLKNYSFNEHHDFICPKPEDVPLLMEDLFKLNEKLEKSNFDFVMHATILSFLFVYIHPFNDGNGRISRFLINWLLYKKKGNIYPISVVINNNIQRYYDVLNEFSATIQPYIQLKKNTDESIQVVGETINYYRHYNLTKHVNYMFGVLNESIQYCLCEKNFLLNFDELKLKFPTFNDKIFICILTNGKVGAKKRRRGHLDISELNQYFESNIMPNLDENFFKFIRKINSK